MITFPFLGWKLIIVLEIDWSRCGFTFFLWKVALFALLIHLLKKRAYLVHLAIFHCSIPIIHPITMLTFAKESRNFFAAYLAKKLFLGVIITFRKIYDCGGLSTTVCSWYACFSILPCFNSIIFCKKRKTCTSVFSWNKNPLSRQKGEQPPLNKVALAAVE